MHVSGLAALQDQGYGGALFRADQVLLHAGDRQQGGDSHVVFVHAAVRENDYVGAGCRSAVHCYVELLKGPLQGGVLVIQKRDCPRAEAGLVQISDLEEVDAGQDRVVDFQDRTVGALLLKEIAVRADVYRGIGHYFLPEGVNGRVGNLGKELLEIVEQQLMLFGKHRQRRVVAHGEGRLHAVFRHGKDLVLDVLIGVAEDFIQPVAHLLGVDGNLAVGDLKVREVEEIAVQPLPVGASAGVVGLALLVGDDPLLFRVNQKDPAGLEAGFLDDALGLDVQNADF